MPLYEYRCAACGRSFDKLRRMQDADAPVECPYCESERTERQISTFATGGGCGPGGSAGRRFT